MARKGQESKKARVAWNKARKARKESCKAQEKARVQGPSKGKGGLEKGNKGDWKGKQVEPGKGKGGSEKGHKGKKQGKGQGQGGLEKG